MFRFGFSILSLIFPAFVTAIHLDVAVSNDGGKLRTDFCLEGGPACTNLPVLNLLGVPPFTVPVDVETGQNVFVSDFSDTIGGNATNDPGYIAGSTGQLPGSSRLSYRAIGQLMYWDPATKEWSTDVPGTTRIRLFGGLNEFISTDPELCGGALFCIILDVDDTSTVFTESGVSGNPELVIGETSSSGLIHDHLDWFLEDINGTLGGPTGAYMVEMQVTIDGVADSDPFQIIFSQNLSIEQFGEALAARIGAPAASEQVPLPLTLFPVLGLVMIGIGLRRVR